MATLKELNQLQNDIAVADRDAKYAKQRSEQLKSLRTSDRSVCDYIKPNGHDPYPGGSVQLVRDVIEEFKVDLLRIIEMREDAKARALTAKASKLRLALSAAVDTEPMEDAS